MPDDRVNDIYQLDKARVRASFDRAALTYVPQFSDLHLRLGKLRDQLKAKAPEVDGAAKQ